MANTIVCLMLSGREFSRIIRSVSVCNWLTGNEGTVGLARAMQGRD